MKSFVLKNETSLYFYSVLLCFYQHVKLSGPFPRQTVTINIIRTIWTTKNHSVMLVVFVLEIILLITIIELV